jgi:hypothetical protein
VQLRSRHTEIFNVMMYVAFMLEESFLFVKRRHDEMQARWSDVVQALKTAKAKAAMEHELRMREAQQLARAKEEMDTVKEQHTAEAAKLTRHCQVLSLDHLSGSLGCDDVNNS